MPDARIRRAAAADLPVLTRLWQTAFGDPPELIGAFYHRFPPQAAAWVVEVNGTVVTADICWAAGCIRLTGPLSPAPMSMRSLPIRRSRDTAMRRH